MRSYSISSFWEIISASATSSLVLRTRIMPLRASTSFGSSAASGMRHYNKGDSPKREKKPIKIGLFTPRGAARACARRASSRSLPTTSRAARRLSSLSHASPAATRNVRVQDAWRRGTIHLRSTTKSSPDHPLCHETQKAVRRKDPPRAASAREPRVHRSRCACRSRPRRATPSLPQATQSSLHQKIDDTRERLRIHTPAHPNAVTVTELNLDEPRDLLGIRRTLARRCSLGRQHGRRAHLDLQHLRIALRGLRVQQSTTMLPPPSEHLFGVDV